MNKPIIYQILPRLWGNDKADLTKGGSLEDNGTGKLSDIDNPALEYFKWLGCTHIWYTGIIRHATKCSTQGCSASHPQFVKGEAGSPYAITDYYDVNPYLADNPENRMEEFESLVRRTHEAGLKVIIDFVPNHVARDYGRSAEDDPERLGGTDDKSVLWAQDNDFFYYPGQKLVLPDNQEFNAECSLLKMADFSREYKILPAWLVNVCREKYMEITGNSTEGTLSGDSKTEYSSFVAQYSTLLTPYEENPAMATGNSYTATPDINDWYETIKLNYCDTHSQTWDKMLDILQFWVSKGVDGFRCDMVELVPPQFFQWAIRRVKERRPDVIFIAEVYKKDLYRKYIREVGFDYLYDKSGLYDTLRTIVEANVNYSGMPIELWQSTKGITRNWQYLGDLQPYMLNFLENHDEQRFASDFFGQDVKNTFAALYVSLFLNRAPFMIYFGEEMGERGMDDAGFSGKDGRTTIFDWWSLESVRALRKIIASGLYKEIDYKHEDAVALNDSRKVMSYTKANMLENARIGWPEELQKYKEPLCRFVSAVRMASEDEAVSKGTTYDLCYCNSNSEGFDINRHFAFLRDHGNETLLFVANFSDEPADMKIRIPAHAFDWLELKMTDTLNSETDIEIKVPAMDGIVLPLSLEKK